MCFACEVVAFQWQHRNTRFTMTGKAVASCRLPTLLARRSVRTSERSRTDIRTVTFMNRCLQLSGDVERCSVFSMRQGMNF